jgi:hypothetical protein
VFRFGPDPKLAAGRTTTERRIARTRMAYLRVSIDGNEET